MSSSDSPTGSETRLVRTTGLGPSRTGRSAATDEEPAAAERLRERVAELEGDLDRTEAALAAREERIEELEADLETARRERDDARQWAAFLDRELREHRDRVETLEARVEALESEPAGLLDRLRGLLG